MGFNLTIMAYCYLFIYVIIANFQSHYHTLPENCYGYDLSGLEDKFGLIINTHYWLIVYLTTSNFQYHCFPLFYPVFPEYCFYL